MRLRSLAAVGDGKNWLPLMLSAANNMRFEELLGNHGLEAHKNLLAGEVRDSVSLFRSSAAAEVPLGASRYGGLPDLPSTVEWPTSPDGLLGFFMQLNLADLPSEIAEQTGLRGMLFFFLEQDDHGPVEHVVVHTPETELVRTQPPNDQWAPDVEYNYKDLKPHALTMRLAFDGPGYGSEAFELIDDASDLDGDRYFDFLRDANLGEYEDGLVGQLFGHPDYTDRDPFAYVSQHTSTDRDEWTAFWRIDSDTQSVGSCIMDHGAYQLFVRRTALEAKCFDSTFAMVVRSQ